jgi:hypothetical protein
VVLNAVRDTAPGNAEAPQGPKALRGFALHNVPGATRTRDLLLRRLAHHAGIPADLARLQALRHLGPARHTLVSPDFPDFLGTF